MFAELIRFERKNLKMTESELAERAGISRSMLQRIEKADPKCEIGVVFEVAVLLGLPLFDAAADEIKLAAYRRQTEDKLRLMPQRARIRLMTSEQLPQQAFVWIWLPGETKPVVAGRLSYDNARNILFNYGRSYLERVRDHSPAIPIYLPELPLQSGMLPLSPGLTMPSSIRDSAPDAWGRRVIINRKLGMRGADTDTALLDELTYCWSPVLTE